MNFLVFRSEQIKNNQVEIKGVQARDWIKLHQLKPGIEIAALLYSGNRGTAKLLQCESDYLLFNLDLSNQSPAKLSAEFIVGISRPQTIKKVIQIAMSTGVATVHFVLSENSEKSYLTSKIWSSGELEYQFSLAMGQTGDSQPFQLHKYNSVTRYLNDFDTSESAIDILGDLQGAECGKVPFVNDQLIRIAVGPEKGWSESEVQLFRNSGFKSVSLGPRMLRVENALACLAGKFIF